MAKYQRANQITILILILILININIDVNKSTFLMMQVDEEPTENENQRFLARCAEHPKETGACIIDNQHSHETMLGCDIPEGTI
jgi:hypothetical protein